MNNRQQEKSAQDAAESARRAGEQMSKNTKQFGSAAAETGERVARVGADVFQNNTEAVQHAWRSGLDMATNLSQRSADYFASAFGFSGGDSEKAMQQSAKNVEAMFRSTGVVAQGFGAISQQWFAFMRERLDDNLNRINELWRCRTPHDLAAVHSDLMRDNLHGLLENSRRVADMSLKVVDDAAKKITENVDTMRRAA
jgi:phasin family protein